MPMAVCLICQILKQKRGRFPRLSFYLLPARFWRRWLGPDFYVSAFWVQEKDVVLSVAGEEEIVYGQEINYRVRYRNNQGASLSKVVLQVRYPEGFVFIDSSARVQ